MTPETLHISKGVGSLAEELIIKKPVKYTPVIFLFSIEFVFEERLPLTDVGKVDRKVLKKEALDKVRRQS